jgi:hypothetical protein
MKIIDMAKGSERAGLPQGVAERQERGGGACEEGKWRRGGETSPPERKCERILIKGQIITLFQTP